jgi:hypothetical protein
LDRGLPPVVQIHVNMVLFPESYSQVNYYEVDFLKTNRSYMELLRTIVQQDMNTTYLKRVRSTPSTLESYIDVAVDMYRYNYYCRLKSGHHC